MQMKLEQAGRFDGRTYYVCIYDIERDLKLPFDGLPFSCLLHRVGSEVSPVEIEDLTRRLLAQNMRAVVCAGEGTTTMKNMVERIIRGEGWAEKHGQPIPVSWSNGESVKRILDDFTLCNPGGNIIANYGLIIVLGDTEVAGQYREEFKKGSGHL